MIPPLFVSKDKNYTCITTLLSCNIVYIETNLFVNFHVRMEIFNILFVKSNRKFN